MMAPKSPFAAAILSNVPCCQGSTLLAPKDLLNLGIMVRFPIAGVAELVNAPDSKSGGAKAPCRFEPDLRYS